MRKTLIALTLLLSVLALTAAMPTDTQGHRWYGPGWGYSYVYPSHGWGYTYSAVPRGYVTWPGGKAYIGYGGVYRSAPAYRGKVYYGWGW